MARNFVEFHCIHNDGPVTVDAFAVNEIREITDDPIAIGKGPWTRMKMNGSDPVEIREKYLDVVHVIAAIVES